MYSTFPIRAVVLGVAGAAVGSILWAVIAIAADMERAIPAVLIGVCAGAATRVAPNRGRPAQLVAFGATLVGLAVVQYFVVRHTVGVDLSAAGQDTPLPLFLSPAAMWYVTFGWLRVYPVDIAFWVVSAAAALVLPAGSGDDPLPPSEAFLRTLD